MISTNAIQDQVVEFMGQMAEMCAFSRSIGQIYGFLYIFPEPVSLEEIAKACRMSKGNASIHLRTLESWGAVHRVGIPGTRKDYYSANTDLRGLAIKRLQDGLSWRLEHANKKIKGMKDNPAFAEYGQQPEGAHWKTRFDELEAMIQQVQSGYALLPKLFELRRFLPL